MIRDIDRGKQWLLLGRGMEMGQKGRDGAEDEDLGQGQHLILSC